MPSRDGDDALCVIWCEIVVTAAGRVLHKNSFATTFGIDGIDGNNVGATKMARNFYENSESRRKNGTKTG